MPAMPPTKRASHAQCGSLRWYRGCAVCDTSAIRVLPIHP